MVNVAIYRTCDRPRYTESTFPHLVASTSPDTRIIMVENSGEDANIEANRRTFESVADARCEILVAGQRLGITKPIIVGVEHHVERHGEPHHVLNVDDDIMVPSPHAGVHWDEVLSAMLDGPWEVAGIFRHIWDKDAPVAGEGLAAGIRGKFIAAGCCGFRYSTYKRDPLKDKGIATFNIWSSKYRCGWSAQENFLYREIDKYAPKGESLRYSEYKEYSEHIDDMRAELRS